MFDLSPKTLDAGSVASETLSMAAKRTTKTGTWTLALTGSETGSDDDGTQWTMQTWLATLTTKDGAVETMGFFASDTADATKRLAAIAY